MKNASPLAGDPGLITLYYKLGLRMLGIAHFANNDFGDSSTDPAGVEWHGLSPKGRELVTTANRLEIVLDASHASDDVLDQLLELSAASIVLSHSGAKAIYDHQRNVDDVRVRRAGEERRPHPGQRLRRLKGIRDVLGGNLLRLVRQVQESTSKTDRNSQ